MCWCAQWEGGGSKTHALHPKFVGVVCHHWAMLTRGDEFPSTRELNAGLVNVEAVNQRKRGTVSRRASSSRRMFVEDGRLHPSDYLPE